MYQETRKWYKDCTDSDFKKQPMSKENFERASKILRNYFSGPLQKKSGFTKVKYIETGVSQDFCT